MQEESDDQNPCSQYGMGGIGDDASTGISRINISESAELFENNSTNGTPRDTSWLEERSNQLLSEGDIQREQLWEFYFTWDDIIPESYALQVIGEYDHARCRSNGINNRKYLKRLRESIRVSFEYERRLEAKHGGPVDEDTGPD